VLETWSAEGETWRGQLLEASGYRPVRWGFSMVRDLSQPVEVSPLPAGVEVRPVAPERVRAVWLASDEAFRDHWGYVEATETDYQSWLHEPFFNPALWMVAWDTATGEVAGQVQNFVNQEENAQRGVLRGYTEGISVRRPWRRKGLARALLTRSLQMFKDQGFTEACLGVDAENLSGALNLYQSVGFREIRRFTTYRKPLGAGQAGAGA
jgi:ribosomal protein S18 acetylase RimI-like enzyme